jgi:hypothetical protein
MTDVLTRLATALGVVVPTACPSARTQGETSRRAPDPRVVRQLDRRYDHDVTEQTQALLSNALRLTVDERAELAAELLASLDGEPDAARVPGSFDPSSESP